MRTAIMWLLSLTGLTLATCAALQLPDRPVAAIGYALAAGATLIVAVANGALDTR
jgi:hypothetical protein